MAISAVGSIPATRNVLATTGNSTPVKQDDRDQDDAGTPNPPIQSSPAPGTGTSVNKTA